MGLGLAMCAYGWVAVHMRPPMRAKLGSTWIVRDSGRFDDPPPRGAHHPTLTAAYERRPSKRVFGIAYKVEERWMVQILASDSQLVGLEGGWTREAIAELRLWCSENGIEEPTLPAVVPCDQTTETIDTVALSAVGAISLGTCLLVLPNTLLLWRLATGMWRESEGRCPECGYLREGLAVNASCPECGHKH